MSLFKIRVVHLEGKSLLVLDGQIYRLAIDLESTDDLDRAISIVADTLIELFEGEDELETTYQLDSCKFGHLAIPSLRIRITATLVEVKILSSIDRRTKNQQTTDALIELTLLTTNGNPLASHARSSIIDVIHASYCSLADFQSAFDWEPSESLAIYLYLDAIRN